VARRHGLLLGALIVVAAAAIGGTSSAGTTSAGRPTDAAFLERHWRVPIPAQGPAPARYSPLERSLAPVNCGTCHPAQFADWKTSLHAQTMGPGVVGQLVEMRKSDPETARLCLTCHAPLTEQQPDVGRDAVVIPNQKYDDSLYRQGLVCAACHVRQHERFGPPRRDGSTTDPPNRAALPHNGVTRHAAFVRSEFCSSCHQFTQDGFALNGKLLENTYEEWKASPAARSGQQCQDCHMPDRRHLWRGIHDPDMVKSGVDIGLATDRERYRAGDEVRAKLTLTASRVGHFFPTYVTPKVVVRFDLVDRTGKSNKGSVQEHRIGRQVALDLSREIADTRIPPGGSATFDYRRRVGQPGVRLRATVTILPDDFYTGFFESLLRTGAGSGTIQIREALDASRRSRFEIWKREVPLT
jgi:hypothetical protein